MSLRFAGILQANAIGNEPKRTKMSKITVFLKPKQANQEKRKGIETNR